MELRTQKEPGRERGDNPGAGVDEEHPGPEGEKRRHSLWSQSPTHSRLALPVTSYVTLGGLLNVSEPQRLICKMGIVTTCSQVGC